MIRNHLKTAFRYFSSNRSYTLISLAGLSLGFLCYLILNVYVSNERNYDIQHGGIYRLLQHSVEENQVEREIAAIGPRIGPTANESFPEIENVAQLMVLGRLTVGNDPVQRYYELVTVIDTCFFDVFSFGLKRGSRKDIFSNPNAIILTETLARKYFGDRDPLHQTLKTNIFEGWVAGIMEDFPSNTHLYADLIIPPQTAAAIFGWWDSFVSTNWHRNSFQTYFKIGENHDLVALENKITQLAKENWPEDVPFKSNFSLQPVEDIHLYSHAVEGEINRNRGNVFYVKLFYWISLLILLVACFNYAGLLNVAFQGRSKEIGVRKVMGAGRIQIIRQLLLESLILVIIAFGLAWIVFKTFHSSFTRMFDQPLELAILSPLQIGILVVTCLLISVVSIGYPGWLAAAFAPVKSLKDETARQGKWTFRKGATLFQFIAAIILITSTLVLYSQANYLQTKELGFNKEGLLVVDINSGELRSQFRAIKTEFSKLPEVENVCVSSRVPGEWKLFPNVGMREQGGSPGQLIQMIFIGADEDFLKTYDISLLEGNNFTGNKSDSIKILLNEAAVKALDLTHAVGSKMTIPTINFGGDNNPLDQPLEVQVSGVVADFHLENFREAIKPMVIASWQNPLHSIDYYTLRINTSNWNRTISALQNINYQFDQANPLEYTVLNDQFERFYESDFRRSRLLLIFSGVVILIACLGLLVLVAFSLQIRTKEIGIRKVLGAEVGQIISLIASDFLKIIAIAALIAIPVTWILLRRWLDEYAYRIDVKWWYFAVGSIVTLIIAIITIGFQSYKAAKANPVEALRNE